MDRRKSLTVLALGSAAAGAASTASAQASGSGIKATLLYGHPPNPAEFEEYYVKTHLPIVWAIKGPLRREAAKCQPLPDGTPPPYYRIFEAWYESPEHLAAVAATPEAKAAGADVAKFTAGVTLTRFISKLG